MSAPAHPGRRPRPETLDALRHLVGFDTTSRNSNLPLIDWLEATLAPFGARIERISDLEAGKASLWVSFGPEGVPGWVLSGHTDTVPVDGQDWSFEPFALTEREGRLYGRGSCDMKGFLACCLGMLPEITAAPLARPIHIAFSYDEEVGCLGVRPMLRHLVAKGEKPLACIVGEPTEMAVAIGHKAKRSFVVTFHGIPGHSSRAPEFVNAVEYGARLIVKLQELGRRLALGAQDPGYDTPHSTAHVGLANGGQALNIVPELFRIEFELRTLPADDPDALEAELRAFSEALQAEMQAVDPRAYIDFVTRSDSPGVDAAPDAEVTLAAQRFAQKNEVIKVAYGTEGGLFQFMAGIPTVVCGPGSIDMAHKPDEYIELEQLALCEAFIGRLIAESR